MKKISWYTFYDKYDQWAPSTIKNAVYALEDFGSPDSILEVAEDLEEPKTASLLIRKAIENGVKFSVDDLDELKSYLTPEQFRELTGSWGLDEKCHDDELTDYDSDNGMEEACEPGPIYSTAAYQVQSGYRSRRYGYGVNRRAYKKRAYKKRRKGILEIFFTIIGIRRIWKIFTDAINKPFE